MNRIIRLGLKDGKETHIDDAIRGAGCGCVCVGCGQALVARQGNERAWHFAHAVKTDCDYGETALHYNSKEIIARHSSILIEPGRWFEYDQCKKEYRIGNMRVDALLTNSKTNKKLVVEIVNRNELTDRKIERLNSMGYDVLEIDLSGYDDELQEDNHTQILIVDYDEKTLFNADYAAGAANDNVGNGLDLAGLVAIFIGFIVFICFYSAKRYRKSGFR